MTTQSGTRRLTREQMRRCLEGIRAGFDNAEIVYQRENRVVLRWQDPHLGTPLIIKMWSRPELLGTLRRLLRITSDTTNGGRSSGWGGSAWRCRSRWVSAA